MAWGYDGRSKSTEAIMQARIVTIRTKDWLYIGTISIIFSLFLSLLCYFLVDESLPDGLLFGVILGFMLFASAFLFTTTLNQHILPLINKRYWLWIAGLTSFLSGFFATMLCYALCSFLHVKLLSKFESHILLFSFFIGFLSYVVALLLYQFVIVTYAKEYQEKLLTQSRLKSLERQLNPHFLFNALNSITELLHINTEKAENALLSLSDFLRTSMKENALISLKEELENIYRYVAIENIRFDGSIFLHVAVEPKLYVYHLPKFSIQLIVENAIKHGYQGSSLTICIDAHMTHYLIITISNDGKAIQSEQFGIGLTNLQERLFLLSKGSLELTNHQPTTFKITLKELT